MKDLSFFLLKNSLGAKMRKGIRTFCNDNGSTSTLNQHKTGDHADSSCMIITPSTIESPSYQNNSNSVMSSHPTLEEMIFHLELEEELARKANMEAYGGIRPGRMSCVNNSDILRSARNALNQYPRFSLDGKDAMYRSSFRNLDAAVGKAGRKSVCCDHRIRERFCENGFDSKSEKTSCFPSTLAGESVIWCKPGVVAKLMGLEAMPVPITRKDSKQNLRSIIKRQNLSRKAERHEKERRLAMGIGSTSTYDAFRRRIGSSCSGPGYCVMKPVAVESTMDGGWPTRRFP